MPALVYGGLFLWSSWPAIHYISANLRFGIEPFYIVVLGLLYVLAVSAISTIASRVFPQQLYRLAAVLCVGSYCFFGVQHVRAAVYEIGFDRLDVSIMGTWLTISVLLMTIAGSMVRNRKSFVILTVFAAVGYFTAIAEGAPTMYRIVFDDNQPRPRSSASTMVEEVPKDRLRNVYYILIDTYLRSDLIRKRLDYDNSKFDQLLEARGFILPKLSRSNYVMTAETMASTLSMEYLSSELIKPNNPDFFRKALKIMLGPNSVYDMFHDLGYSIIVNYSWYCSDYYVDRCFVNSHGLFSKDAWDFLMMSPIPVLISYVSTRLYGQLTHDTSVLLDDISDRVRSVKLKGKRVFMLLHFLELHDMIYDADCNWTPWIYEMDMKRMNIPDRKLRNITFYKNSIGCVNTRITELVDQILARDNDPIIVITGDHGVLFKLIEEENLDPDVVYKEHAEQAYGTFSAWRLPESCQGIMYDKITNVNHFRVIRACLTGEKPNLLEDIVMIGNPRLGQTPQKWFVQRPNQK